MGIGALARLMLAGAQALRFVPQGKQECLCYWWVV